MSSHSPKHCLLSPSTLIHSRPITLISAKLYISQRYGTLQIPVSEVSVSQNSMYLKQPYIIISSKKSSCPPHQSRGSATRSVRFTNLTTVALRSLFVLLCKPYRDSHVRKIPGRGYISIITLSISCLSGSALAQKTHSSMRTAVISSLLGGSAA